MNVDFNLYQVIIIHRMTECSPDKVCHLLSSVSIPGWLSHLSGWPPICPLPRSPEPVYVKKQKLYIYTTNVMISFYMFTICLINRFFYHYISS